MRPYLKSKPLILINPRYLKASKLFTCFIFYVDESPNMNYSKLQQLRKMQKLCQKRALEVNKKAKSQISQAPQTPVEEHANLQSTFKPSVRIWIFGFFKTVVGVLSLWFLNKKKLKL